MDKKFFFQIFGLLIVIFGALILTYNPNFIPPLGNFGRTNTVPLSSTGQNVVQIVSVSNQVKAQVLVEIADTDQKRSLGLGGRASLAPDAGMLFIMPQRKKPTFWMKGMLIPLDFIWIDGN